MTRRRAPRRSEVSWPVGLLMVVGILGALVGVALLGRWVAATAAPGLYLLADGDHARLVAILAALWALVPLGAVAAVRLGSRRGRWWGVAAAVPLVPLGLFLWGTMPGRGNNGRLARSLNQAVDGGLADTGEVFVSMALAGLITNFALMLLLLAILRSPVTRTRRVVAGVVFVGGWVGAGMLVLAVVGDTEARGSWLDQSAEMLAGGDEGLTGDFPVGIDPSVLEVVDCETAAAALRVDGEVPELDGCRQALLVAATGRYEQGEERLGSGELVAVVVQTRTEDQLVALDAALDDVELVAAQGLPDPPGPTLATKATAALSLVVAAEDPGDIPLPAEGAGQRPLTRALAYVVIGTAQQFYIAPPEETPAGS